MNESQNSYQLVDLTDMVEPDEAIDIMEDFSLQRCDLMPPPDSRSRILLPGLQDFCAVGIEMGISKI
jgi:hypothetical protein